MSVCVNVVAGWRLTALLLLEIIVLRTAHGLALRPLWGNSRVAIRAAAARVTTPPTENRIVQVQDSLGHFFENSSASTSFIQCQLLCIGQVAGTEYGVGCPVDAPVALTYFDGGELKSVTPESFGFDHYDHLVDHVANHLESSDLHLHRTPVVLTLQGDLDEDSDDGEGDDEEWESNDQDDEREVSLSELLKEEKYFEPDTDQGGDEIDSFEIPAAVARGDLEAPCEINGDESFWSGAAAGVGATSDVSPGFQVIPGSGDLDDIPTDAIVTEGDERRLHIAHRKADRILAHAVDVRLVGSFHFRKRNFHLVRLLEPLMLIGERMSGIRGMFFTLLDEGQAERIKPALEALIIRDANDRRRNQPAEDFASPAPKDPAVPSRRGWLNKDFSNSE